MKTYLFNLAYQHKNDSNSDILVGVIRAKSEVDAKESIWLKHGKSNACCLELQEVGENGATIYVSR